MSVKELPGGAIPVWCEERTPREGGEPWLWCDPGRGAAYLVVCTAKGCNRRPVALYRSPGEPWVGLALCASCGDGGVSPRPKSRFGLQGVAEDATMEP